MPSHTTHNTPALRFPGYTGVWEQQNVGNIATIVGGGTPATTHSEYWNGTIDWYAPAEIINQRYVSHSQRQITQLGLEKSSAQLLPAHKTVLFTSRAGIGKMAILQREAATNQGFQSLVLHDGIDPYFIYSMNAILKKKAEKIAAGSTFLEISGSHLAHIRITIPSLSEQKQIGSLFHKLDDRIDLHQRQTQKLKKLKTGLLQNMFPREGESVPRLRFPGFTTHWEQQKLKEIADFLTGHVESKIGDVLLPVSGYTPRVLARTKCVIGGAYNLKGDVNIIRPHQEVNGQYLSLSLNSGSELIRLVQGSIGKRIPFSDVPDKVRVLVAELAEQQKIARFFELWEALLEYSRIVSEALVKIRDVFLYYMFPRG